MLRCFRLGRPNIKRGLTRHVKDAQKAKKRVREGRGAGSGEERRGEGRGGGFATGRGVGPGLWGPGRHVPSSPSHHYRCPCLCAAGDMLRWGRYWAAHQWQLELWVGASGDSQSASMFIENRKSYKSRATATPAAYTTRQYPTNLSLRGGLGAHVRRATCNCLHAVVCVHHTSSRANAS